MCKETILSKILKDREQRFALRQEMVARGLSSVSLNLNIPGYPKSSDSIQKAFKCVLQDLLHFFVANRIHYATNAQEMLHSDCGDFFLQGVTYTFTDNDVKTALEEFETMHTLGRLLDVDLMNNKGRLLSSGKQKKCFLCENSAKECMKNNRHSFTEYKNYIDIKIAKYLNEKKQEAVVTEIMEKALKATLFEISVEQKPGLVCPSSNGSHEDMDYFTFLSSSASLADYWRKTATYGYETGLQTKDKFDYKKVRMQLRFFGLEAETKMLQATQGVNTQKGIIFLIGLSCFGAAFVFASQGRFCQSIFRQCVRRVMQDIVSEDFEKGISKQGTHGESVFKTYGKQLAGGARLEAEQAFPTVFNYTLEYLQNQTTGNEKSLKKEDWQEVLTDLLLLIISKNNDINILYRKNASVLKSVQCQAARVLAISERDRKIAALRDFSDYCMLHNISPGGAADLLALSLFIYFIQNLNFSNLNIE